MRRRVVAAVDIGGSGGRVMAGIIDGGRVALDPIHRFANGAIQRDGHLRWEVIRLYDEVLTGLTLLARKYPEVESIGIDTWAVDYALLDEHGDLLAEPIAYRDARTDEAVREVHAQLPFDELFAVNGLQFLPFNTIYQLAAERHGPLWDRAARIVLLPDLVAYWLTGELRTEATNASTTGLIDVRTGSWSAPLLDLVGVPESMLSPIDKPGDTRGRLRPDVAARTGLAATTPVTTVGSHDTASAVVGVPATGTNFAYIASGTWSLVGLELTRPVTTARARDAKFSNEGGVDGRTRFLRNVGGLWLLQESMRTWADEGRPQELATLLVEAAALPSGGPVIDVDDERFIPPDNMPARISAAIAEATGADVRVPGALVRCVLESLAAGYASAIALAAEIAAQPVEVVHVVGGGSQNDLLCRLTATATQLPVIAGPVEATALGNVLVQARAVGAAPTTLEELRQLVAASTELRRYDP
ncbi:MAG TPA: rhamnulokinase family protein [Ilumatobacteraceae bacterium]